MSVPENTEPLRRGALELLASGNSMESVAHVFGVSVDVVKAWRDGSTEAPGETPMPAPAGEGVDAEHARPAASMRFGETLDYSTSTGYRRWMFFLALVLLGMLLCFVAAILHGPAVNPSDLGLAIMMALGGGPTVILFFGFARISLVLDEEGVVVPGVFRDERMPYSEVAGYSLTPGEILAFRGGGIHGETLRIRSLRPGVEPLEAFIAPHYPVDGDIIRRLDAVSSANRSRHVLPASTAHVARSSRTGVFFFGASVIVVMLMFMPMLREGLRKSRLEIPAKWELQHREGRLTSASRCYRPSGRDSGLSMKVGIEGAASASPLLLPCLLDYNVLMNKDQHRVAVDVDPSGVAPDNVYQVELDGRIVLDYDTARARRLQDGKLAARVETGVSLMAIGGLLVLSFLLARRRFRPSAN